MYLQWEADARVRRLNDPFPLSVEWTAADTDLVESWPFLRELAGNWPGQSSEASSSWAVSPRGLAGKGGEIALVFGRIPTRRLVVLGEPGAGKTMLLIRLLLDLVEHRSPGGAVPVLFSLASWDPDRHDLYPWMADELAQEHSALRARAPASLSQSSTSTQAYALLEQRLILPILDGLDELPQAVRARALQAINEALPAGQPLVLSCRTAEYRSALTTPSGTSVLLNGAAGIRLLPLEPEKAAAYLTRDAGAAARWRAVSVSLGSNTPVSEALSTPLSLFLARTSGGDDLLHDIAMDHLETHFGHHHVPMSDLVAAILSEQLGSSGPDLPKVARLLSLHPRSVQRSLSKEGTTFSGVVDRVRRSQALHLITTTDLSFSQIAAGLGMQEQSSLTRAVRRWFDTSPSRLRREAQEPRGRSALID